MRAAEPSSLSPGSRSPKQQKRPAAYGADAPAYDWRTVAFQGYREHIVTSLSPNRGDVVLDVGCGSGLCWPRLQDRVGPDGTVVGIDESPEMVGLAKQRAEARGWDNVAVVQSPVAEAKIPVRADAALFCAVHDVLQSPEALHNVIDHLRPGAWVAAGGGKFAAPWLPLLNYQVMALHAPFVRSFDGFDRPWRHLERLLDDVRIVEVAFGMGYVAVGRVPN
jgi:SAM-dependent methyltransferase